MKKIKTGLWVAALSCVFAHEASVANAVTIDELKQQKFVPHAFTQKLEVGGEIQQECRIEYLSPSIRRQRYPDGRIDVIDMSQCDLRQMALYPEEQVAEIQITKGFGSRKDPYWVDFLHRTENDPNRKELGKKRIGTVSVYGLRSDIPGNAFEFWIDDATGLPVQMIIHHLNSRLPRRIICSDFDFEPRLNPALFKVEAPDGYSVRVVGERSNVMSSVSKGNQATVAVLLEKGIYTEETVGDLPRAIEIYQQIVADDLANRKSVAEALFRLGRCYAAEGQSAAALAELRRLVDRYPDQKELVERAKLLMAELSPQPLFPELAGCRLKYPASIVLGTVEKTKISGELAIYQTDMIELAWSIEKSVQAKPESMDVVLITKDGKNEAQTIVLAQGLPGSARMIPARHFDDVAPGEYILRVIGTIGGTNAVAGEFRVQIKPIMVAQLGLDEIQPNRDIRFISVQQSRNTGETKKSHEFRNSDFVHIEKMVDGDGRNVEFTESREGNYFRYRATLNKQVIQGELFLLGSQGWKEGMIQQVPGSGEEFRYRMNHTPGTGEPIRRVEIFRLPQGAELLATTPVDLPYRLRDGQVEILVDTIIPAGGSLLTEFRYRLGTAHAKIVVEDLALRLLVAIRDKDDDVLRELSTDRIDGWRDALPVFAGEVRERFRQMTGGPFDMRVEECRIQGDFAAVKCVGPEALKGVYLVLFFEQTESGWKNITIKNSPPSKSLESHLFDFLKTAQKDKSLHLQAIPWKSGEVLRYRLLTKTGMEMGTMIWAVSDAAQDGKSCWKIEQRLVIPLSGTIMSPFVVAEKESFIPLSSRTAHQLGTVEATYLPGKVLLRNKGADTPREVMVPDPIYDNEQALFLMRRLPLADAFQTTFPIMSVLSGVSSLESCVRVMGRETLAVASESYDCWKVRIEVYAGTIKAVEQMIWFTVEGHVPVKFVADQLDIELAEQTTAGQTAMELKNHAVTLHLPDSWFGYELPTIGKGSEIVHLLPPDMKIEAMLCKTVRQPAAMGVKEISRRDIEVLKSYLKNYTVRENSVVEKEINGASAYLYAADYEDQGKPKTEYRAYYVVDSRVFWFVFRMDADCFLDAKSQLDELMNGLEVK